MLCFFEKHEVLTLKRGRRGVNSSSPKNKFAELEDSQS
jgi:hypothetical protein